MSRHTFRIQVFVDGEEITRGRLDMNASTRSDLVESMAPIARQIAHFIRTGVPRVADDLPNLQSITEKVPKTRALSPRQRQILNMIALGQSSKEIAFNLGLSVKTVFAHRGAIRHKVGLGPLRAIALSGGLPDAAAPPEIPPVPNPLEESLCGQLLQRGVREVVIHPNRIEYEDAEGTLRSFVPPVRGSEGGGV